MNETLIEAINAIGKLSVEVIAIITLSVSLFYQAKEHANLALSVQNLASAITKKETLDEKNAQTIKESMNENTAITKEAARLIQTHTEVTENFMKNLKPTT